MPLKKHQWLYLLTMGDLLTCQDLTNEIRTSMTPAEKGLATKILKEKLYGPKKPSLAEGRARLLGRYKYHLTGIIGNLSNAQHNLARVGETDLPPSSREYIDAKIYYAMESLQLAMDCVRFNNDKLKKKPSGDN